MKRKLVSAIVAILLLASACSEALQKQSLANELNMKLNVSSESYYKASELLSGKQIRDMTVSGNSLYFIINEAPQTLHQASATARNVTEKAYYTSDGGVITAVCSSWDDGGAVFAERIDRTVSLRTISTNREVKTIVENISDFKVNKLRAGNNGNIYIFGADNKDETNLRIYTSEGKLAADSMFKGTIRDLAVSSNGTVYAAEFVQSIGGISTRISSVSLNGTSEASVTMSQMVSLSDGNESYTIYCFDSNVVYGIDFVNAEQTPLLTLSDLGLGGVLLFQPISNDPEFIMTNTRLELLKVTLTDVSDDRTVLTLASYNPSGETLGLVDDFNLNNSEYRIELKDYSMQGNDGEGMTKLLVEILTGNVPDMFDFGETNMGAYSVAVEAVMKRGYLEDLYPYIDGDEEINRDTILPNVLTASEVDGKLYEAFSFFRVTVYIGLTDVVGAGNGWSVQDMLDIRNSMSPQPMCVIAETMNGLLETCARYILDDYIDWENGSCNFDSDEFVNLLEVIKTQPVAISLEPDPFSPQNIFDKKVLLDHVFITGPEYISAFNQVYGNYVIKGFPNHSGSGNYIIRPQSVLTISSTSKHKDACWSFVRKMYTEDYQDKFKHRESPLQGITYAMNIPTNVHVFNAKLERMRTDNPKDTKDVSVGGFLIRVSAVPPEEDITTFINFVNSTTQMMYEDKTITKIVTEECASFFAGDRTAKETARLIQNRASLYIDEQS